MEFPNNKDNAKDIMNSIAPIKNSEKEDLKLIAQRIFDNIEKKFAEKVPSPELPKKRSHEKSEESKKNGDNSQEKRRKYDESWNRPRNDNRRNYDSEKRYSRKDDYRHKDYQRRNY